MNAPDLQNTVDVEACVLGSLLARRDAIHELPAGFGSAVFTDPTHAQAFAAISVLAKDGSGEIDLAAVCMQARLSDTQHGILARCIGAATPWDVARPAGLLLERKRRADLRAALGRAADALRGDQSTADVVGGLMSRLLDLDAGDQPEVLSFKASAIAFLDEQDARKSGKASPAVKTGYPDLDGMLRIRPGNLALLAARAHMGKTTLALNIADNVALQGRHVLIHSLEMSDAELISLTMARAAGVNSEAFTDERPLPPEDWDRVAQAIDKRTGQLAHDGHLHINQHYHGLGAICRITEKTHRKFAKDGGLALVVVDYLQLVQPPDLGKGANREREVATISRTLKLLARRLGVPVLALCQLNREPDKRAFTQRQPKPRYGSGGGEEPKLIPAPKLHELRESGALEQDADHVLMLHNPFAEAADDHARRHGPYKLTVAKQRLGRRGAVNLRADLEHARFSPWSGQSAVGHVIGRDDT